MAGLIRCVIAPRPWRPSKLRLVVEAQRTPGGQHVVVHGQAHRAARFAPFEAGAAISRSRCLRLGLLAHGARARHHHRAHAWRHLAAAAPRRPPARRSSMRPLVHEPMNTCSTRRALDRRAGWPARCSRSARSVLRASGRRRARVGMRPLTAHRLVGAGAPGDDAAPRRLASKRCSTSKRGVRVASQRRPVRQRALAHAASPAMSGAVREHVVDGRLVGRDQRAARAGFDRHVAQREARLDRSARRSPRRSIRRHSRARPGRRSAPMTISTRSLAVVPTGSVPSMRMRMSLGHPVDQGLRRQHVLDLGGADAEAQRARARRRSWCGCRRR